MYTEESGIKLLYCIVLYCIVLYCIVLYCIVLYCIVLYCIVLYCIVLYCIVLYCIVYALKCMKYHLWCVSTSRTHVPPMYQVSSTVEYIYTQIFAKRIIKHYDFICMHCFDA